MANPLPVLHNLFGKGIKALSDYIWVCIVYIITHISKPSNRKLMILIGCSSVKNERVPLYYNPGFHSLSTDAIWLSFQFQYFLLFLSIYHSPSTTLVQTNTWSPHFGKGCGILLALKKTISIGKGIFKTNLVRLLEWLYYLDMS